MVAKVEIIETGNEKFCVDCEHYHETPNKKHRIEINRSGFSSFYESSHCCFRDAKIKRSLVTKEVEYDEMEPVYICEYERQATGIKCSWDKRCEDEGKFYKNRNRYAHKTYI